MLSFARLLSAHLDTACKAAMLARTCSQVPVGPDTRRRPVNVPPVFAVSGDWFSGTRPMHHSTDEQVRLFRAFQQYPEWSLCAMTIGTPCPVILPPLSGRIVSTHSLCLALFETVEYFRSAHGHAEDALRRVEMMFLVNSILRDHTLNFRQSLRVDGTGDITARTVSCWSVSNDS